MPDFPHLRKWYHYSVKHISSVQIGRQMAVALRQDQARVRALTPPAGRALGCCFIAGPANFVCATALRRAGQLEQYSPLSLGPPFLSFLQH